MLGPSERAVACTVDNKLAVWEGFMASTAISTKARCQTCECADFVPITDTSLEATREVRWFCNGCSCFCTPRVPPDAYDAPPVPLDKIPKVPDWAPERLLGSISIQDLRFYLQKLKRSKSPGADEIPYELLIDAPEELLGYVHRALNAILEGE